MKTWSDTIRECLPPVRWNAAIAAAVLGLMLVHPRDGWSAPLCLFRNVTGVPCPGCGMMRSMTCTLHGDLPAACAHHPFGPLVVLIFGWTLMSGFAPAARWCGLRSRLQPWRRASRIVKYMFIAGFLVFGVIRAWRWIALHGVSLGA